MTKIEFLVSLDEKLSGISENDKKRTLDYYAEMIDDRVEEGMSEDAAVAEMGSIEEIVKRIFIEIPLVSLVKEKIRPKRKLAPWEITLLVIGAPLWIPLIVSAFAVILSVWIVFYSVIISLYAIVASLAIASLGGLLASVINFFSVNIAEGLILLSFALIAAGLTPLLFFAFNKLTRLIFTLSKNLVYRIKKIFAK